MLKKTCFFFLYALFAFSFYVYSEPPGLYISEIMFNPNGDENAREFVEIYNGSDVTISIEGFKIGDSGAFDEIIPSGNNDNTIPSKSYAVIFDPDYFSGSEPYDIPENTALFTVSGKTIGLRGLSNSVPETIYLISSFGDTLSKVTYSIDCPPGHSWEKIFPDGPDSLENFKPSQSADGTPGKKNSVTPGLNNPALDKNSLILSSGAPEYGKEYEFNVSFRNMGLESVSAVRIKAFLKPDIDIGEADFTETVLPQAVSGEKTLKIKNLPAGRLEISAVIISENDSAADDSVSVFLEVPPPDGYVIINEVMAAPSEGLPEWVEFHNTGTFPVDINGFKICDESGDTVVVNQHLFIESKGFAVVSENLPESSFAGIDVVYLNMFPALNNDGDNIRIFDFSGACLDSMRYENAVSGKSFELISPALRGKENAWDICVASGGSTPGKINSINYSSVDENTGKEFSGVELKVTPNPFSEEITISYRLPEPLARVRLYLYDRRGRLISKIRDEQESGSEWKGVWTGGSKLPAGPYILNFEALNKRTGKVYTERKVVVKGAKL